MQKYILQKTIKKLLVPGKGILAADESTSSIGKRFEKIGVDNTEEMRMQYREMLFNTPNINKFITGVILYEETLKQKGSDGELFRSVLKENDIVVGCKIDQGLAPLAFSSTETVTKGLEGLADRADEYFVLGARFTKWRAAFVVGKNLPSEICIKKNAELLASYSKICQNVGLVPIVEPEVLSDGEHTSKDCLRATTSVLKAVFAALSKQNVDLRYILLKPNMIVPGTRSGEEMDPLKVANLTISCLKEVVPKEVPGVVFLSGGQNDAQACLNLNAMASYQNLPWMLTYSFSRALQNSAMEKWAGNSKKKTVAQKVFFNRAKLASLAQQGKYKIKLED